jgi:hypothetical protein
LPYQQKKMPRGTNSKRRRSWCWFLTFGRPDENRTYSY